jgi:hypothetical protein
MNIILIIILLVIILILIWALLGGKSDVMGGRDEGTEEDKTFRRRATDKQIEKDFPESAIHPHRRKTDPLKDAEPAEDDQPFKLPYLADEIIPETSRFRIYRRTLLNSEIYASKSDFSTSISLYEGVRTRIQDIDTQFKIDANIEYLRHYKKKKEEQTKRKEEQAKRGVSGEGGALGGGNEIKIKLGGMPSNAIRIDNIPETINIGVYDPSRNMDVESIVQNVTQKIRGELSDVKDEITKLRGMPTGEAAAAQTQLVDALSGLSGRIDRLDGDAMGGAGASIQADDLTDLKKEFQNLNKSVRQMAASRIPESATEPSLAAAKFDSRAIPRQKAGEPSAVKEPGAASLERLLQKKENADEEDEFELLSEYGKDKVGDELSDDEIFEKILREDGKGKEKGDFEIIGEKKERRDDVTTTEEIDLKQREDESFYKRLLSTTKRKKKELPILKVSYDFSKLPDEIGLSREKNIIEYAFYKYKPMLEKANEFIKKRKVRDAINYYKVVMSQNIPPEFKSMIRKNLDDLNEYLEKYLTGD